MNRIRANLLIESRFPFVCLVDGLFRVVFFEAKNFEFPYLLKKFLGKSDGPKWISNFVKKRFCFTIYGGLGIIAYW